MKIYKTKQKSNHYGIYYYSYFKSLVLSFGKYDIQFIF